VNVVELLGLPALEDQLGRLEPLLVESVVTGDDFLDEVTTHLLAAGGKRLRPVLALATATSGASEASLEDLLGAEAGGDLGRAGQQEVTGHDGHQVAEPGVDALDIATHSGLVHHVVVVERRQVHELHGHGTEIAGLLAATLGELCQGQVAEVHAAFQANRSQDQYRRAIAGKTAALMATSCRIGALTGGLSRPQVEAFTSFGRSFGMVFQVRDDILDVIGTEAELGKPAGQDLAEGVYTLPVLLALADPVAGPELSPLLGQPLGQPERDKARSIVAESGAIEASVVVAHQFADEASAAVAGRSPELAAGFSNLAHSLVDDLPTG
jgi:heptaprenyl diphosphate synthase